MKGYVKSIGIVFLAMALCFVSACTGYVVGKEDGLKESPSVVKSPLVIAPKEENNISLAVADIAMEDYEAYGVSATAESAKTITATVTPDYATNKEVDYSITWVNANSEWASGKAVTDYVTVVQESDGALTATVSCLQAFGEQIQITCVARSNENAKATCTVDFERIIDSISFVYGGYTYTTTELSESYYRIDLNSYDYIVSKGLNVVEHTISFDSNEVLSFDYNYVVKSSKPWTIEDESVLLCINTCFSWTNVVHASLGYENSGVANGDSYLQPGNMFTSPFSETREEFLPGYAMPLSLVSLPIYGEGKLLYSYSQLVSKYGDIYSAAKSLTTPHFAIMIELPDASRYFACYVRIDPDSINIPVNAVAMSSASLSF